MEFLLECLATIKKEKGGTAIVNVIKKSGLDGRLMEFFPSINQQQTEDNVTKVFMNHDLAEVVSFRKQRAAQNLRQDVQEMLVDAIAQEKATKEIIVELKDAIAKGGIQDYDATVLVRPKFIFLER